ncbi:MAG: ABC transporter ATP-binding protein [Dongiaceae bacterium]
MTGSGTTGPGLGPPPAFELHEVAFAYRDAVALAGVSLTLPAGSGVALLGPNGSGKSTLLRLLDALCFPDHGRILAFGRPLTEALMQDAAAGYAFRRRVGLVFQNPDIQLFCPTVLDELAFGPLQLGWPKPEIRRRIEEVLETFALGDLRHRAPHRLSGGEKKRVALASVLISRPEVVLLDEPTAGLDPRSQDEIVALLAAARGEGRTVVTATHDLQIVETIADHCIVLGAGRLLAAGPPARVLAEVPLRALR